jgi:hypothetical protein
MADPRVPRAAVIAVLRQQAALLGALSHEIVSLPLLQDRPSVTVEMAYAREDIAACADRLADVLWEAVLDLESPTLPENAGGTPRSVAYGPQMARLLALLRRADAWLETLTRAAGAHLTLPGFAPGAPPIETQLGLQ